MFISKVKCFFYSLVSWLNFKIRVSLINDSDPTSKWERFVNLPQVKPNFSLSIFGFYMLEVESKDSTGTELGELIVSSRKKQLDIKKFPIKLKPGVSKRICYFDDPVAGLHFSASSEQVLKNIKSVTLKKTSKGFSIRRLKKKVGNAKGIKQVAVSNLLESYEKALFPEINYNNWIDKFETKLWVGQSSEEKKFSIITPIYNTQSKCLLDCAKSVLYQTYKNFEWIIVDDCSDNKQTLLTLECIKALDPRIIIIHRLQNGHISQATNTGVDKSSGDFTVFLDHDDMLARQALNELAFSIQKCTDAKLIYSDEDLTAESGERLKPHFKPDFNLDLLFSYNYITHLCCYDTQFLKSLGGLKVGVEGAQDYDLLLRAVSMLQTSQIVHIPKVLYHWRMVEGSTAQGAAAKPYSSLAGKRALEDNFAGFAEGAAIEEIDQPNFYKVSWPISSNSFVSIIIPTRDGVDILRPCIASILATIDYERYELIVIDNGSQCKKTLAFLEGLKKEPKISVLLYDAPFNYSQLVNYGVKHARGDVILLLNDDVEAVHVGWFEEMLSLAIREDIGCVGSKLLYPDGDIQHAGVVLGLGGYAAHSHRGFPAEHSGYFNRLNVRQNISAVTAACLMIKKRLFNEVSGFDEQFAVAYNDVDFCLKVRNLGVRNIFTPFAKLIHHESKTRGKDTTSEQKKRFDQEKRLLYSRWEDIIVNDPAYNPNLTRSAEDFSIRGVYES